MSFKVTPKGFFATNNYGIYFYLLGSLIFFFQMHRENKVELRICLIRLLLFVLLSYFLVYYIQPNFHK